MMAWLISWNRNSRVEAQMQKSSLTFPLAPGETMWMGLLTGFLYSFIFSVNQKQYHFSLVNYQKKIEAMHVMLLE